MHIGLIVAGMPFNWNNIIWLDEALPYFAERVRSHPATALLRKDINNRSQCEKCGTCCHLEAHHLQPVWAFCTDLIARQQPCSTEDLWRNVVNKINHGEWDATIPDVNNHYLLLCKECHVAEQKNADQQWKKILSARYPLVWSVRTSKREAMAITNRFYGQKS